MKCESTGKTAFPSKRDAHALINVRKDGPPLRAYPCPDCNEWHVTKKIDHGEIVPRKYLNQPIKHIKDFLKYISK